MSQQIAIRIPDQDLARARRGDRAGRFPNRAAALREALTGLLREERRRAVEDADRRGYGAAPQESWVGELGLAAFASLVEAEESGEDPL